MKSTLLKVIFKSNMRNKEMQEFQYFFKLPRLNGVYKGLSLGELLDYFLLQFSLKTKNS